MLRGSNTTYNNILAGSPVFSQEALDAGIKALRESGDSFGKKIIGFDFAGANRDMSVMTVGHIGHGVIKIEKIFFNGKEIKSMAKPTIKKLLEQVENLKVDNDRLASLHSKTESALSSALRNMEETRQRNITLEMSLTRANARAQEILVAHDILLRTKMRADGVEWEEIERIIENSRRNVQFHDGAAEVRHPSRGW